MWLDNIGYHSFKQKTLWTKFDRELSLTTQDNRSITQMVCRGNSRGGDRVWDSLNMSLMNVLDISNECHPIHFIKTICCLIGVKHIM